MHRRIAEDALALLQFAPINWLGWWSVCAKKFPPLKTFSRLCIQFEYFECVHAAVHGINPHTHLAFCYFLASAAALSNSPCDSYETRCGSQYEPHCESLLMFVSSCGSLSDSCESIPVILKSLSLWILWTSHCTHCRTLTVDLSHCGSLSLDRRH